jgi:rubrerythrin
VLGGASALLLAGCGKVPVRTLAGNPRDVRVLAAAMEAERTQIAVYEAGVALGAGRLAETILSHERAHLAALEELVRELGAQPPGPRPAADYRRGIPRSLAAWRRYATRLEQQWSAGYAAAIPKLVNPKLRSTFGALMTTEAEHAVALDLR